MGNNFTLTLSNPYVQIGAGFLLIIFSIRNLRLTPARFLKAFVAGFAAGFEEPTSGEKESQKEGPSMPGGCWTFILGSVLLISGTVRLIVRSY